MGAEAEESFVFAEDEFEFGFEGVAVEDWFVVCCGGAGAVDALAGGDGSVFAKDVAVDWFCGEPLASLVGPYDVGKLAFENVGRIDVWRPAPTIVMWWTP